MADIVKRTGGTVASVTGPIYLLLFPVPVVCFIGALLTDIAYSQTAYLMWAHFSSWLIFAGLVVGALAALALLIELIAAEPLRSKILGWGHVFLFYATLIVEIFNALIHSKDGWTSVVPGGLILSIVATVLALLSVATLFFVPVAWVPAREARS